MIDADHGGRWEKLSDPSGRQWLWSRPDAARYRARPGDAFVDAGGLEECFPTIGDRPDHGMLWARPWRTCKADPAVQIHRVAYDEIELERELRCESDGIQVDYHLTAPPGTRFIWAAHALLELGVGARIDAEPGRARAWPDHALAVETTWPYPLGIDFAELGPDDGSAMFCLLPGRGAVQVNDRGDSLRFQLACPNQPVSVGVWRNLGGYPWRAEEKYRNIGIEPMLGNAFDLNTAGPSDAAVVPASGRVRWSMTIENG
ncbi:hypothetical protein [Leifsonia sp. 22587]|uniref:hypothetical protein n=1 Tax=Leifsonia sp. 22587 TaxID=3453946 RepID=UPI003F829A03